MTTVSIPTWDESGQVHWNRYPDVVNPGDMDEATVEKKMIGFSMIGAAFEETHAVAVGRVGNAVDATGLATGAESISPPNTSTTTHTGTLASRFTMNKVDQLSDSLFVHRGATNVGILRHGRQALLIDCGAGDVSLSLAKMGITQIDLILCTHHHRDSVSGLSDLIQPQTELCVPHLERRCFEEVDSFWNDPQHRWHLYDFHPHNLMLSHSIAVDRALHGGETIQWRGAMIRALHTPGHTDGSMSYVIDVDGGRFAFSGDLIYDEGQIWELYSLQKGDTTTDYHAFLGDRERLQKSLELLLAGRSTDAHPHPRATDPSAAACGATACRASGPMLRPLCRHLGAAPLLP